MSVKNNCITLAQNMRALSSGIINKETIYIRLKGEEEWRERKPDSADGYHDITKMNFDKYEYASESLLYKKDLEALKNTALKHFSVLKDSKHELERLDRVCIKYHNIEIVVNYNEETLNFYPIEKDKEPEVTATNEAELRPDEPSVDNIIETQLQQDEPDEISVSSEVDNIIESKPLVESTTLVENQFTPEFISSIFEPPTIDEVKVFNPETNELEFFNPALAIEGPENIIFEPEDNNE